MKKMFLRFLKVLAYPVIWCHRVIMEAPLVDADRALLSTSDWSRYRAVPPKPSYVPAGHRGAVMHR